MVLSPAGSSAPRQLTLYLQGWRFGEALPPEEQQLLSALHCEELVLNLHVHCKTSAFLQTLSVMQCDQLLCRLHGWPIQCVDWAVILQRAGIFVLFCCTMFRVTGCSGIQQVFAQGWALVKELLPYADLPEDLPGGLPLHLFSPGPHGHLVWRNSAVTDEGLERAYDLPQ